MHGVPRIILSGSLTRKLLWALLFIGSWVMFMIQTEQIFENYLTHPKKTNIEIVSDDTLFPDVTICIHRRVSFYDAQEWLLKKERLQNNETSKNNIKVNMKLVSSVYSDARFVHPIFYSEEFQSTTRRSAISKEEAFIDLFAELSNGSWIQYRDMDIIEVFDLNGLGCFTVSFVKYNNRVAFLGGYLLTGNGMIPDLSNDTDYPWKDVVHDDTAVVYIHQAGG